MLDEPGTEWCSLLWTLTNMRSSKMILQFLDLFHCCTTCVQLILLVVYNFQMHYWNLGTCNIAKKSQSAINKEKMMINCELEDWPPARTLTHCHYCGFWTFPLQWGIIIIIIKWAHFQFWLQIKWFWLMPSVYFQHHSLMGPSRAAVHVGGVWPRVKIHFLSYVT